MKCPRCSFESPSDQECTKCGIIFARYGKPAPKAPVVFSPVPKAPLVRPGLLVVVLALGAAGAFYLHGRSDSGDAVATAPNPSPATRSDEGAGQTSGRAADPGASTRTPPGGPSGAVAAAPRRRPPTLPRFSGWRSGASAFQAARARQRSAGAPVLLYVGVDWCPYCKQFKAKVMPDPNLKDALQTAMKVEIDPEKSAGEKAIAKRMGITGYPTLLLLATPDAQPVRLPTGVSKSGAQPRAVARGYTAQLRSAWHRAANEALQSRRLDDAVAYADRALALDERDPGGKLYHLRGLVFYRQGDAAQYRRDIERACQEGHQPSCASLRR